MKTLIMLAGALIMIWGCLRGCGEVANGATTDGVADKLLLTVAFKARGGIFEITLTNQSTQEVWVSADPFIVVTREGREPETYAEKSFWLRMLESSVPGAEPTQKLKGRTTAVWKRSIAEMCTIHNKHLRIQELNGAIAYATLGSVPPSTGPQGGYRVPSVKVSGNLVSAKIRIQVGVLGGAEAQSPN